MNFCRNYEKLYMNEMKNSFENFMNFLNMINFLLFFGNFITESRDLFY